jgi:hypothetical protein
MGRQNRLTPFIILIVIFLLLQPALILLDRRQTPETAARAFVKDYFYLDPAMENWLCSTQMSPAEAVDNYLYAKRVEATQRGFDTTYLRQMFTDLHLATLSQDEQSATVHVTGTTRTAINPVYMTIGRWFGLGQNHPVDLTLELVKENGQWRVCGGVPGL